MEIYQINQLEAASKILEILGVSCPHTLEEKIKTIEASKTVLGSKLKGTVKNYCIAMTEVANEIKADRLRREDSSLKNYLRQFCVKGMPNSEQSNLYSFPEVSHYGFSRNWELGDAPFEAGLAAFNVALPKGIG